MQIGGSQNVRTGYGYEICLRRVLRLKAELFSGSPVIPAGLCDVSGFLPVPVISRRSVTWAERGKFPVLAPEHSPGVRPQDMSPAPGLRAYG